MYPIHHPRGRQTSYMTDLTKQDLSQGVSLPHLHSRTKQEWPQNWQQSGHQFLFSMFTHMVDCFSIEVEAEGIEADINDVGGTNNINIALEKLPDIRFGRWFGGCDGEELTKEECKTARLQIEKEKRSSLNTIIYTE